MRPKHGWAGLLLLGAGAWQAGALAPLGLSDPQARELVLEQVRQGGTNARTLSMSSYTPLVLTGRRAYQKVPAAQRAQVTSALFGWARAYASTPAFRTEYTSIRAGLTPVPREYPLTIEQEIRREVDKQLAGHEQLRKAAESMPAKDKATMLANLKQAQDQLRSPVYLQAERADREAKRAEEQAGYDRAVKAWEEKFPPDPRQFVAKALRTLLEGTAGVDFSARLITIQGEGGSILWFENTEYQKTKPWMWIEAILAGPDAVAVARTAAEAWLKELGPT
jgi:hypothetical protein